MGVHVADGGRRQVRVREGEAHRLGHRLGARLRDVPSVGVRAEADDFGVNLRPTGNRPLALLEDERPRAVADDESVAIPVKGARRRLGRVVLPRSGEKRVEDGDLRHAELLRAARNHHVLPTERNRLVGLADCERTRRAGRPRRQNAPRRAEVNRQVHRRRLRHHLDVGRTRHVPHFAILDDGEEVRAGLNPARARAVGDAEPPALHDGIALKPRLAQRLFGRVERENRHGTHRADDLARVFGRTLEVRRRPEARLQAAIGREVFRNPHAVDGRLQPLERRVGGKAERTDDAAPRDHNPTHMTSPP